MAKTTLFENELTDEWKRARDAAIEFGIALRNHRTGTKRNDRKLPLWVACEIQDHGVNSPSDIDVAAFKNWSGVSKRGQDQERKKATRERLSKRKEGLDRF